MYGRVRGQVIYDGLGNPIGAIPAIMAVAAPLLKTAAAALLPKVIGAATKAFAPKPAVPVPMPAPPLPPPPVAPPPAPMVAPPVPEGPVATMTPAAPMAPAMPLMRLIYPPPYGIQFPGAFPMYPPVRRRQRQRVVVVRRSPVSGYGW